MHTCFGQSAHNQDYTLTSDPMQSRQATSPGSDFTSLGSDFTSLASDFTSLGSDFICLGSDSICLGSDSTPHRAQRAISSNSITQSQSVMGVWIYVEVCMCTAFPHQNNRGALNA